MKDWRKMDVETIADMVSQDLFGGTDSLTVTSDGIEYWHFGRVSRSEVDEVMKRISERKEVHHA